MAHMDRSEAVMSLSEDNDNDSAESGSLGLVETMLLSKRSRAPLPKHWMSSISAIVTQTQAGDINAKVQQEMKSLLMREESISSWKRTISLHSVMAWGKFLAGFVMGKALSADPRVTPGNAPLDWNVVCPITKSWVAFARNSNSCSSTSIHFIWLSQDSVAQSDDHSQLESMLQRSLTTPVPNSIESSESESKEFVDSVLLGNVDAPILMASRDGSILCAIDSTTGRLAVFVVDAQERICVLSGTNVSVPAPPAVCGCVINRWSADSDTSTGGSIFVCDSHATLHVFQRNDDGQWGVVQQRGVHSMVSVSSISPTYRASQIVIAGLKHKFMTTAVELWEVLPSGLFGSVIRRVEFGQSSLREPILSVSTDACSATMSLITVTCATQVWIIDTKEAKVAQVVKLKEIQNSSVSREQNSEISSFKHSAIWSNKTGTTTKISLLQQNGVVSTLDTQTLVHSFLDPQRPSWGVGASVCVLPQFVCGISTEWSERRLWSQPVLSRVCSPFQRVVSLVRLGKFDAAISLSKACSLPSEVPDSVLLLGWTSANFDASKALSVFSEIQSVSRAVDIARAANCCSASEWKLLLSACLHGLSQRDDQSDSTAVAAAKVLRRDLSCAQILQESDHWSAEDFNTVKSLSAVEAAILFVKQRKTSLATAITLQLQEEIKPNYWHLLSAIPLYASLTEIKDMLPNRIGMPSGVYHLLHVQEGETLCTEQAFDQDSSEDNRKQQDHSHCEAWVQYSVCRQWFIDRVHLVDEACGLIDISTDLVSFAISQGFEGMTSLLHDCQDCFDMVYHCGINTTLKRVQEMLWEDRILFVAQHDSVLAKDSIFSIILRALVPMVRRHVGGDDVKSVAQGDSLWLRVIHVLLDNGKESVASQIILHSKPTLPRADRIMISASSLIRASLVIVYRLSTDQWQTASELFECLPSRESGVSPLDSDWHDLHDKVDQLDGHLMAAEALHSAGIKLRMSYFVEFAGDEQQTAELSHRIIAWAIRKRISHAEWVSLRDRCCKLASHGFQVSSSTVLAHYTYGLLRTCQWDRAKAEIDNLGIKAIEPAFEAAEEFISFAESLNSDDVRNAQHCIDLASGCIRQHYGQSDSKDHQDILPLEKRLSQEQDVLRCIDISESLNSSLSAEMLRDSVVGSAPTSVVISDIVRQSFGACQLGSVMELISLLKLDTPAYIAEFLVNTGLSALSSGFMDLALECALRLVPMASHCQNSCALFEACLRCNKMQEQCSSEQHKILEASLLLGAPLFSSIDVDVHEKKSGWNCDNSLHWTSLEEAFAAFAVGDGDRKSFSDVSHGLEAAAAHGLDSCVSGVVAALMECSELLDALPQSRGECKEKHGLSEARSFFDQRIDAWNSILDIEAESGFACIQRLFHGHLAARASLGPFAKDLDTDRLLSMCTICPELQASCESCSIHLVHLLSSGIGPAAALSACHKIQPFLINPEFQDWRLETADCITSQGTLVGLLTILSVIESLRPQCGIDSVPGPNARPNSWKQAVATCDGNTAEIAKAELSKALASGSRSCAVLGSSLDTMLHCIDNGLDLSACGFVHLLRTFRLLGISAEHLWTPCVMHLNRCNDMQRLGQLVAVSCQETLPLILGPGCLVESSSARKALSIASSVEPWAQSAMMTLQWPYAERLCLIALRETSPYILALALAISRVSREEVEDAVLLVEPKLATAAEAYAVAPPSDSHEQSEESKPATSHGVVSWVNTGLEMLSTVTIDEVECFGEGQDIKTVLLQELHEAGWHDDLAGLDNDDLMD